MKKTYSPNQISFCAHYSAIVVTLPRTLLPCEVHMDLNVVLEGSFQDSSKQ